MCRCLSLFDWHWRGSFSLWSSQKTISVSITLITTCANWCHWYWVTISISITFISNTANCWGKNTFSIRFLDVSISANSLNSICNTVSVSITVVSRTACVVLSSTWRFNWNSQSWSISLISCSWCLNFCYFFRWSDWWAYRNVFSCSVRNIWISCNFWVLWYWLLNIKSRSRSCFI